MAHKCKICGKTETVKFYDSDKLEALQECYHCNFWMKIVHDINNPSRFIINGQAYYNDGRKPEGYDGFQGFDGRLFRIRRLSNKEVIVTNDLWLNGEVPPEFRNQLPDNAVFESTNG